MSKKNNKNKLYCFGWRHQHATIFFDGFVTITVQTLIFGRSVPCSKKKWTVVSEKTKKAEALYRFSKNNGKISAKLCKTFGYKYN